MVGDSVRVGHPGSHFRNVQSTDGRSQVMYRLGEQCLREWQGMRGYEEGNSKKICLQTSQSKASNNNKWDISTKGIYTSRF